MGKVVASFTMSLDGYIAGPNVGDEHPMGEGGEQLHEWIFDKASDVDRQMADEIHARVGAVVLGRRTFDLGLPHWNDTPFPVPSFVVTHERREPLPMRSAAFTFINEGVGIAVAQARDAAEHRDVVVMGASIAQQLLGAGLVDELLLQIAPVLLGQGSRLFDNIQKRQTALKNTSVIASPHVTHVRYEVL
ncbi:dihydrofolate reductase family protein [Phyllobacterium lublinensis]|uniref:dihydrofolate reductase family protein n=1 Tax=Phyllobacterium lublinensis TaxID=2875708 RepID=UPI001CCE1D97|nr:dihydrofolate reductase family protein [Phyllobacterium sp. 2063]MBZ9654149.1 dihydrofolate reductase family protein [Phyllobacterium sp. 2063]